MSYQSIRAINGVPHEMSAEDFANMVFDKIDINGDGKIPDIESVSLIVSQLETLVNSTV